MCKIPGISNRQLNYKKLEAFIDINLSRSKESLRLRCVIESSRQLNVHTPVQNSIKQRKKFPDEILWPPLYSY